MDENSIDNYDEIKMDILEELIKLANENNGTIHKIQLEKLISDDIFENDFFEDIRQKLEESSIEVVDVDDIEEMDDIEGKINIEEDGETENLDSMPDLKDEKDDKEDDSLLILDEKSKKIRNANTSKSANTDDPVKMYLKEIGKIPLLSADEERVLAENMERGDVEAKRRLAEANLRLVVSIAKRYVERGRLFDNFTLHEGTGHSTSFLCERFFTSLGGQVKKKAGTLFPGGSGSSGINEPWRLPELRCLLHRQRTALLQAPDRKCRTLRPGVPSPGLALGRTGDVPTPCTFP